MRRFHANALLTTVIIALLIAMTCSSLLLLAYIDMGTDQMEHNHDRLQRNLRSGINLILADTAGIHSGQLDTIDLFGENRDTVVIEKENWGLFTAAHLVVKSHGEEREKCFFSGPATDSLLEACLYLAQHDIPLYVSGSTLLSGDVYLPKGGILPSYFEQQPFNNGKPLTGTVRTSQDDLPRIDPKIISSLTRFDSAALTPFPPDTLIQSFSDIPIVFHVKNPLTLSNVRLRGHIVVVSDSSIAVGPSADLQDVILRAPFIKIESGYSGNIQAIATDSLVARNECHLGYPSCLILIKKAASGIQPTLRIGDSSTLSGLLLSVSVDPKDQFRTYVEVGKNTTITGFIYASGFLVLKGEVRGTVLTDYFLHKSGTSILQNFLIDGTIDRTKLSKNFVGPRFLPTSRPNKIVQWLN